MSAKALLGALLRGVISAVVVIALLLAAKRWGRETAGLLAGLPTVTGPAMLWLSLDNGAAFPGEAALGAVLAGAVSAMASLLAPQLTAAAAGALTSPPLLAVATAWKLHRQGFPARVLDFLRGYTAGLVGRCAFVALFGALLVPVGLLPALAAAMSLVLALAWGTGVWIKLRSRVAPVQPVKP